MMYDKILVVCNKLKIELPRPLGRGYIEKEIWALAPIGNINIHE